MYISNTAIMYQSLVEYIMNVVTMMITVTIIIVTREQISRGPS